MVNLSTLLLLLLNSTSNINLDDIKSLGNLEVLVQFF